MSQSLPCDEGLLHSTQEARNIIAKFSQLYVEHNGPEIILQFLKRYICRRKRDSSPKKVSLSLGSQVSVEGGRFKGRQGKILQVRGGVVRVQMEGPDGPMEADMAAAHCIAA